jgi:hypothetical protein
MAYIVSPFTTFADTDGSPLNNGYVYIGTANLNPITNPISVYWDDALTQPAAQPLRTLNGFFSRSGTPARVYTSATNFSMVVNDNKGELVYSAMSTDGNVSQSDFAAFQASVNASLATKLSLTGGTMTGAIVLPGAPSAALEAATKGYVDTADALKVSKAGDTMTGKLNMAAAGIGFSDTSTQTTAGVAKTGDTMTGLLVLSGAPVATLGAATKGYVDTTAATGSPVKAWVNFNGVPSNGTYTRVGTLITVTLTAHDMTTGQVASLSFTGAATSGNYTVTVLDANTFTVTDSVSGSTSGNVTRNTFIRASFNVSSITDNGAGDYTINFASALVDANYCVSGTMIAVLAGNSGTINIKGATTPSVNNVNIRTLSIAPGNPGSSTLTDVTYVTVAIIR